jgi:hypothetical protein
MGMERKKKRTLKSALCETVKAPGRGLEPRHALHHGNNR